MLFTPTRHIEIIEGLNLVSISTIEHYVIEIQRAIVLLFTVYHLAIVPLCNRNSARYYTIVPIVYRAIVPLFIEYNVPLCM